jgi:2,3-bisphosphoglycerate-dependent phosphoglycerate mutase
MPSKFDVYLVRHGESAANLEKSVNLRTADHAVPLSERGQEEAVEAGAALAALIGPELAGGTSGRAPQVAAYISPYLRTRQTWDGLRQGMIRSFGFAPALLETESIFLRELEFGLFDGIPDNELPMAFPREHAHYEKLRSWGGEFYARMPGGESRCDVAQRVHQCFGTIHRDRERHGVRIAVVVSHGVTNRAFAMQWLKLTPEWMEAEKNPLNCSIRLLRDGRDAGYVHNGRPGHRTAQQLREEGVIR